MSKIVSHRVCLRLISTLHASYDITNSQRYKRNVLMDLEAIKNKIFFKKLITSLKKALRSFKYLLFFLFKDCVLETQLMMEFLTPNTGVWNQLHKTLVLL